MTVRAWTAKAAPPVAKRSVMIVSGSQEVIRAQFGGGIGPWVLPGLAAGGIIAGVAVPIIRALDLRFGETERLAW